MRRVVTLAKTIAWSHSTVLLRGETGAGKEILARPLHAASPRAEKTLSANARPLEEIIAEAERTALAQAMEKYPLSRKLGSAQGLSPTTVLKKIGKYALLPPKK